MNGRLIIIASPSGGGKGTIIREVLKTVPNVAVSRSLTTRKPRAGETDGIEYDFVSRKQFEDLILSGAFLEYAEVHGNLYGTSRESVAALLATGRDVILEIDVQGAEWVMKREPDAVSIFILPPSYDVLKARLKARATESTEALELRLKNAFDEVKRFDLFEYVIVNDVVADAAARVAAVLTAERQRRIRQSALICDILAGFTETTTS